MDPLPSSPLPNSTPNHVKEADQAVLQALIAEGLNASESLPGGGGEGGGGGGGSLVGGGGGSINAGSNGMASVNDESMDRNGDGSGYPQSTSTHLSDLNRFHSLLKVLIKACILVLIPPSSTIQYPNSSASSHSAEIYLNPSTTHLTPSILTQAENTLRILLRNIELRPEVLYTLPEQGESIFVGGNGGGENGNMQQGEGSGGKKDKGVKIPLYKWIIPRLLHTSSILRSLSLPSSSTSSSSSSSSVSNLPPNNDTHVGDSSSHTQQPPIPLQQHLSSILHLLDLSLISIIRNLGSKMSDSPENGYGFGMNGGGGGGAGAGGSNACLGLEMVKGVGEGLIGIQIGGGSGGGVGWGEALVSISDQTTPHNPYILFPLPPSTASRSIQYHNLTSSSTSSSINSDSFPHYPIPGDLCWTGKIWLSVISLKVWLRSGSGWVDQNGDGGGEQTNGEGERGNKFKISIPAWPTFCMDTYGKAISLLEKISVRVNGEIGVIFSTMSSSTGTDGEMEIANPTSSISKRQLELLQNRIKLRMEISKCLLEILRSPELFLDSAVSKSARILEEIVFSRLKYLQAVEIHIFDANNDNNNVGVLLTAEGSILRRCLVEVRRCRAGRVRGCFWGAVNRSLETLAESGGFQELKGARSAEVMANLRFLPSLLATYLTPPGYSIQYLIRAIPKATLDIMPSLLLGICPNEDPSTATLRNVFQQIREARMRSRGLDNGHGRKRKRSTDSVEIVSDEMDAVRRQAEKLDRRMGLTVHKDGERSNDRIFSTRRNMEVDPDAMRVDDPEDDSPLEPLTSWLDRCWVPVVNEMDKLQVTWILDGAETFSAAKDLKNMEHAEALTLRNGGVRGVVQRIQSRIEVLVKAGAYATSDLHQRRSTVTDLLHTVQALSKTVRVDDPEDETRIFNQGTLTMWSLVNDPVFQHIRNGTDDALAIQSLTALRIICASARCENRELDPRRNGSLTNWLGWGFRSGSRRVRILASQVTIELYRAHRKYHDGAEVSRRLDRLLGDLDDLASTGPVSSRETAILAYGELAKCATEEVLGRVLRLLILSLGSSTNAIRSLAFVQIHAAAKAQGKSPFGMVSPYLPELALDLVIRPLDILNEAVQILGFSRVAFLESTLHETLPALVIRQDRQILVDLARILEQNLGRMIIGQVHFILAKIFMLPRHDEVTKAATFLCLTLQDISGGSAQREVTINTLINSCIIPFLVELVVEFGDPTRESLAVKALDRVHACLAPGQARHAGSDLGDFLKPHMLGIISSMHERLHDLQVKTAFPVKKKILRSLVGLIKRVGVIIVTYAPQIMASFQASLSMSQLRNEALVLCKVFTESLKFSDIGPNIGAIVAALVAIWDEMDPPQRDIAKTVIQYLVVENVDSLQAFLDDVISLDGIPDLEAAARRLTAMRPKTDLPATLYKIIIRCANDNALVATRSLMELQTLLKKSQKGILQLARGETFHPIIMTMSQVLMDASARDGDTTKDLRLAAYGCLGILGALDPDRLHLPTKQVALVVQSGFGDPEEAIDFAMHLIENILVGAFRTTANTKHQGHLAYAIQELLKFCGFSSKLSGGSSAGGMSVSNKVRIRWSKIVAKPQLLETVSPLLEARYTLSDVPPKRVPHPIYAQSPTYREWLQRWTSDLIARLLMIEESHDPTQERSARAVKDAKSIFGVFRGVIRNEDVGVAHYILPHLVLYILVFGDDSAYSEIVKEIKSVLEDQMAPQGGFAPEKRSLSAQAVFDLMDHLSRWLADQKHQLAQLQRRKKEPRNARIDSEQLEIITQTNRVSRMLTSGIDSELVASAALRSRAYARSLRNYEERISFLKVKQRKTEEFMQEYYEHLHELYSALDEPDGMEGISTKVIAPNLEHQIREHETVGRWASAQSCWELALQRNPDDLNHHLGLLRCLRNIGHYDTLRTHIRGVLSSHPEWKEALSAYQVESAWTLSDWKEVSSMVTSDLTGPEISIGRVLLAIQQKDAGSLPRVLAEAKEHIGAFVSADHRQYSRAYPAVVQLHVLGEIEMIYNTSKAMEACDGVNRDVFVKREHKVLTTSLNDRLGTVLPAFKYQESILSSRRAAFSLLSRKIPELHGEASLSWISSAKIARKAGYEQTAYSAILQANSAHAAFAFVQQAKLLKENGQLNRALTELENGMRPLRRAAPLGQTIDLENSAAARDQELSKALMLQARWAAEAGRYDHNSILKLYKDSINLTPAAESPYYRLGHYYDSVAVADDSAFQQEELQVLTCKNYVLALENGTKYIYQTMPRLLTLWLDTAESAAREPLTDKNGKVKTAAATQHAVAVDASRSLDKLISVARKSLQPYQWYTAFPQLVSRLDHPLTSSRELLGKIMSDILVAYPRQAVWALMGAYSSNKAQGDRHDIVEMIFNRVKTLDLRTGGRNAKPVVEDAQRLCPMLLRLSEDAGIDPEYREKASKDYKVPNQHKSSLTLAQHFPYVAGHFPTRMILPLQDALTCTLPSSSETLPTHQAFPKGYITIKSIDERIDIMPSLQRPKKLTFLGDDGKRYNFLVKPHDDLRKDARLMDFNSLINKLLVSSSDSRQRNLYIRTYAVMPLNEECGMLEWVNNTVALRPILTRLYEARGVKIFMNEVMADLDEARKKGSAKCGEVFTSRVIPKYQPAVFHEWFFQTWPEPTAWFASRLAYARTLAVMSMVGFVLGLGDRHGENILFDSTTGDTVHVDFNCLFEKGRTFDISEKVPFRMTLNLVDALGTTGVEGVYRKAAESTLQVLRANRDSLTSVLESFVHDPLVEWEQATRRDRRKGKEGPTDLRVHADRALQPIKQKLRGIGSGDPSSRGDKARELSVPNQVDALIKEATNPCNLGGMYVGWAAWL